VTCGRPPAVSADTENAKDPVTVALAEVISTFHSKALFEKIFSIRSGEFLYGAFLGGV